VSASKCLYCHGLLLLTFEVNFLSQASLNFCLALLAGGLHVAFVELLINTMAN
jgi:hypothetical protein